MQPIVERAAVDLYAQDPALAVQYLTNYTNDAVSRTVEDAWELADALVVKYNDGANRTYPQDWLTAVGFGATTNSADFKDLWYGEYQP
jgi:dipeptidase